MPRKVQKGGKSWRKKNLLKRNKTSGCRQTSELQVQLATCSVEILSFYFRIDKVKIKNIILVYIGKDKERIQKKTREAWETKSNMREKQNVTQNQI